MGVMYFAKSDKGGANYSTNESTPSGAESTADTDTTDTSLDADLGEVELEDPAADFTSVDSDINSL